MHLNFTARELWSRPRTLCSLAVLLATTALAGCEETPERAATHPAQGTVKFNGKPTPGAFIVLHPRTPITPPAPNPRATVDEAGNFVISTYGAGDGAPVGEYDATVRWQKLVERDGESTAGPNILPQRYAVSKDSKLEVKIVAGQNNLPPFELKR